jgi:hypothetical protein
METSMLEVILKPYRLEISILQKEKMELENKVKALQVHENKDLIAAALSTAQSNFNTLSPNKTSKVWALPFSDIGALMDMARGPLGANGLSISQDISDNELGQTILTTNLLHSSGQFLSSKMRLAYPQGDIHTINSYTAAMKRLALGSLLGIVSYNEDDDGEISDRTYRADVEKGTSLPAQAQPEKGGDVINNEEIEELDYELGDFLDIAEDIKKTYNLRSLADLPRTHYKTVIRKVREIKLARKGLR